MDNTEIDIFLITKYLAGEATPEEAISLGHWIEQPGNKEQFDAISSVWTITHKGNIHKNSDHGTAWLRLQKSLAEEKSIRQIKIWPRFYAAAAVVAGIILCGVIYYGVFKSHSKLLGQKFVTIAASKNLLKDTLPDGSIIILNRSSSIRYPESFNKTTRHLSLSGEAYFSVAPDKENPFIINEGELNIKVVGTLFNVSKKDNPRSIEVQVQSGIVKMYTSKKEITVVKGQTGIYMMADEVLTIANSLDANSMGYATGNFSFTNLSLREITGYLEKAFGVNINFKNTSLSHCRMTARFENKSLDYIMHVIAMTLNVQYTIQPDKIYIDGQACN